MRLLPFCSIWRQWLLIAVAVWMSVSPATVGAGNPRIDERVFAAANRMVPSTICIYLYANGDPVMFGDPSGNCSIVEIGVAIGISAIIGSISHPVAQNVVGRAFAAIGFSPGSRISLSSLGVYEDSAQLIQDFGLTGGDFSGNLLVSAAQELAAEVLTGKAIHVGLASFARFRAARMAPPVNFSSELSGTNATLRKNMGLSGSDQAHHIIPWSKRVHALVQRAARGGFNINGINNGIALDAYQHTGGFPGFHPAYNDAVEVKLDSLLKVVVQNELSDIEAAVLLQDYVNQLRGGLARKAFSYLR